MRSSVVRYWDLRIAENKDSDQLSRHRLIPKNEPHVKNP